MIQAFEPSRSSLTIGNVWSGRAADKSFDRTLIAALAGVVVVLIVFAGIMQ